MNNQKEMCENCEVKQEELIERTDGLCEQIICMHMINEEAVKEGEKVEVVAPTPAKKRKFKVEKKNGEEDVIFPTTKEMNKSVATSFSSLPVDVVYQITNAKKKTDEFSGDECADLTLKGKGEYFTHVVRSTKAIYNKLYQEEKYEEDCMKNNFYIMSKGPKLTSKKWTYLDFIILTKEKL